MICRSFPVCSTQMERKKAGMKCVIFAGLPAAPELHGWWADADYVIAADAGYENACRVGVEPDLLLGDYDSAPRPEAGAKTVFLPAEKDDTDTYYAARKALELGATDVVIVGGLGGARLDHTLAALNVMVQHPQPPCIMLAAEDIVFLAPPALRLPLAAGTRVSLFPMGAVTGRSEGLLWPIDGIRFTPEGRVGTSNAAIGPVQLSLDGTMMVMLPRECLDAALTALTARRA